MAGGVAEIRPRDSTPYAVMLMPSSRVVRKISRSTPRSRIEYSICRSAIGWTAWALRMVSAPTSDRPMCRTVPFSICSAMAPMVSSIGTFGSSRAGR